MSGLTICLASSFFMCKFSFILSPLSWDCFCPNELLMWIRPWHYIPDLQSHNSQSISVTVIHPQPWFHTVPKCSQFCCPSRCDYFLSIKRNYKFLYLLPEDSDRSSTVNLIRELNFPWRKEGSGCAKQEQEGRWREKRSFGQWWRKKQLENKTTLLRI